jgi:hypothetical protein
MNDLIAVLDDEEFVKAWAELQEEAMRAGTQVVVPTSRPHH